MNYKISILHPSYGRPQMAYDTFLNWIEKADDPESIQYILCLSVQDVLRSAYIDLFDGEDVEIVYTQEPNMVKQVNHAATYSLADLLINISDDFDCPDKWDLLLLNALKDKTDFVVKTWDGLQKFIITLPIFDRVWYKRFGYVYHPSFFHFFGDEMLADVGKILGKTIKLDILFQHKHYTQNLSPKDEVNNKNNQYFEADRKTYLELKQRNFLL